MAGRRARDRPLNVSRHALLAANISSMQVQLLLTCLCDAFYGEVGIATVRVLEHAGCTVRFPKEQTCCGQPALNSGDFSAGRTLAQRLHSLIDPALPIVSPSASCAATLRHGYGLAGLGTLQCFELAEFLTRELALPKWPLAGNVVTRRRKVAVHEACHARMLGSEGCISTVLRLVKGVELVGFDQQDQCCGFGGAFAVSHPSVSAGIGTEKLRRFVDAGVDEIVGSDMGCLMHLDGLAKSDGLPLRFRHVAEILAEGI